MLRLNLNQDPVWVTLIPGIRIEVAPVTTPVMLEVYEDLDAAAGAEDAVAIEGRHRSLAMAKSLACRVILDWDGVGDTDGNALPITDEGVRALLDHLAVYTAFQEKVVRPAMEVIAEGNGSAPAPNGTSARA